MTRTEAIARALYELDAPIAYRSRQIPWDKASAAAREIYMPKASAVEAAAAEWDEAIQEIASKLRKRCIEEGILPDPVEAMRAKCEAIARSNEHWSNEPMGASTALQIADAIAGLRTNHGTRVTVHNGRADGK